MAQYSLIVLICRSESTHSLNDCMLGSSVVDWLLKWHFADSRLAACRLAQQLLCQAHILPLLPSREKKSPELTASASKSFCDSSEVCYRFVCTNATSFHVVYSVVYCRLCWL